MHFLSRMCFLKNGHYVDISTLIKTLFYCIVLFISIVLFLWGFSRYMVLHFAIYYNLLSQFSIWKINKLLGSLGG